MQSITSKARSRFQPGKPRPCFQLQRGKIHFARIAAVARRYAGNPNPLITLGTLKVDLSSHAIHGAEGQIDLSQREWVIFEALLQRPGQIVSKSQIEDQLYSFDAEVESNTIEVYVSRLRKKLGKDAVQTIRGLGYRLGTP